MKTGAAALAVLSIIPFAAVAAVKPAALFGDHMVLQAGIPVPELVAEFDGGCRSTEVNRRDDFGAVLVSRFHAGVLELLAFARFELHGNGDSLAMLVGEDGLVAFHLHGVVAFG